ncbi:hypothetical protein NPIL_431471 [Nephila pilipes]|uniref:Endonuclease/exonuclease/phosphatase domain-containing protein n=1 Tax=Nephila pilipes TaxID=299642 RepID=A0A8X6TPZ9_NEPPI|nr:hypothetical protein NPIL_431471 [Nephila pilipes]
MNSLTLNLDAALSIPQINQGRARSLGRGPCSPNQLQSPQALKILQCSINGSSTLATRSKLEQLLEIADMNKVHVIAIQETKLKETTALKIRGYNIFRADKPSRRGGTLAFFIRDAKYQGIDFSLDQSSDLEIQGVKIFWREKPLHILNIYHPPNESHQPTNFSNFMDKNTIILGDLNAKHTIWGSSCNNNRGEDILQMMDNKELMILNDGSSTHSSLSNNNSEALAISITSADIFPQCTGSILYHIGSDHFPILIKFSKR